MFRRDPEKGQFTLDDFMAQMGQVQQLGPMAHVMRKIPGLADIARQMSFSDADVEREVRRMRGIFDAMNAAERRDPELFCIGSRLHRVARGAGVPITDVSRFLKQFEMSRDMMRALSSRGNVAEDLRLSAGLVTESKTERDPSYLIDLTAARWRVIKRLFWFVLIVGAAWLLIRQQVAPG
jgi:signal recognition particle subunit SRP54